MGIHPNAGWRSFKTDKPVSYYIGSSAIFVAAPGLSELEGWAASYLTPFGQRLLQNLLPINAAIAFIRIRERQFEIFITKESGGWEAYELHILREIAKAYDGDWNYELETRDMSGGNPTWDAYLLEELEEIEEFEDSFVTPASA